MKRGDVLPNGATVIAVAAETRDPRFVVILAMTTCPSVQPYVTWTAWADRPNSTTSGHYFESIGPAAADFHARVAR